MSRADRPSKPWRLLILSLLAPAVLLIGGCGQQVAGSAVAAADATASEPEVPTTASRPSRAVSSRVRPPSRSSSTTADIEAIADTWEGRYWCGQGPAALRLVVSPAGNVLFQFSPLSENPAVESGSYTMRAESTGGGVVFTGETWTQQPPGYVMVDLEVTSEVGPEVTELSGRVLGPGCRDFQVTRK